MSTITQRRCLSMGELAVHFGLMEARLRRFLATPRPYLIRVGRARGVAEGDLPLLAADLTAAGLLRAEPETTTEKHDG